MRTGVGAEPYIEFLSECIWIGFKATDDERKALKDVCVFVRMFSTFEIEGKA